jgi:hypothetical protein
MTRSYTSGGDCSANTGMAFQLKYDAIQKLWFLTLDYVYHVHFAWAFGYALVVLKTTKKFLIVLGLLSAFDLTAQTPRRPDHPPQINEMHTPHVPTQFGDPLPGLTAAETTL